MKPKNKFRIKILVKNSFGQEPEKILEVAKFFEYVAKNYSFDFFLSENFTQEKIPKQFIEVVNMAGGLNHMKEITERIICCNPKIYTWVSEFYEQKKPEIDSYDYVAEKYGLKVVTVFRKVKAFPQELAVRILASIQTDSVKDVCLKSPQKTPVGKN